MLISKAVQAFLTNGQIAYRKLLSDVAIDGGPVPAHERVRVLLLCDHNGPLMAVFPVNSGLDFEALVIATGRQLKVATAREFGARLQGLSNLQLPPFGDMLGIDMIVDEALLFKPWLRVAGGEEGVSYLFIRAAFVRLVENARFLRFSRPVQSFESERREMAVDASVYQLLGKVAAEGGEQGGASLGSILAERLKTAKLPAMPETGQRLAIMKAAGDVELLEVVHAIEMDPVVSAHVMKFACSAFFSYQGRIASIRDAVFNVLGVDIALNLALGIAVGRTFKGPLDGPLGLHAHWRHAVRVAALTQALAAASQVEPRIQLGTAYLAGLVHNIGFLLMAQLAPGEYKLLNKMLSAEASLSMADAEQRVFGIAHTVLAQRLFTEWNLPAELVAAAAYHHDASYVGRYSAYSRLVLIADRLLQNEAAGEAERPEIPDALLRALGLEWENLQASMAALVDQRETLEELAAQFAA